MIDRFGPSFSFTQVYTSHAPEQNAAGQPQIATREWHEAKSILEPVSRLTKRSDVAWGRPTTGQVRYAAGMEQVLDRGRTWQRVKKPELTYEL